ncbi:polysaccharide deacetylase family protein [Candidatus Thioglobus autotrophicus]|uniref:polysaccharide deacetylase family protein n=1 Tax=Candidatus Thioglobus autotrophicus TaxID=1705394 RepID=UPI00299ECDA9|nr:polysaccharide deacetylase family protein [Candidatus Thioglobus autotrophicus]WPE15953.1 polysaccharide deacetylase family protein [Candidatus Thioglobus autotrophicus]
MDLDDFLKQLDYFESTFNLLNKKQFEGIILNRHNHNAESEPLQNNIVLTFDDGFQDHYRYVFPELVRRNTFGIFYIATYPYLTGKMLDVHRIHLLIGKYGGGVIYKSIKNIVDKDMFSNDDMERFNSITYNKQNNDNYTDQVKKTLNYYIKYEYRGYVIDKLMGNFFPNEKDMVKKFYLSKDNIIEMHKSGMIIGSHTVNHKVMSRLTLDEQRYEIEESFLFLEELLGPKSVKTFCYPYGGFHSFTKETEVILDKNKCLFSFNVESRDINHSDLADKCQKLPRYNCNMFYPLST